MQKRVITLLMIIVGASLGISFLPMAWQTIGQQTNGWLNNTFTNSLLGALIFFLLSLLLAKHISAVIKQIEEKLSEVSLTYLLFGAIGGIIGLTLGVIISTPLYNLKIPFVNSVLPILLMVILGYLGFRMGTTRIDEWKKIFGSRNKKVEQETPSQVESQIRGLDILNALQKEEGISVEMYDGDFEDITEVDSKLIKLAKLLDGVIVTNDYNLNKVSEFQNVPVLNINALANAVKPVVIPGENMNVLVVKAGTERQQGVAYLYDGTMVVVEDGQHYMNEHIEVVVTSALQTAAGRMIFAKPAHAGRGIDNKDNKKETEKSKHA